MNRPLLSAVDIFVKDLGLVLDTARATKFPLPLASTAHQMFMQASSAGFGREDDSAVIKIFPGDRVAQAALKPAKACRTRLNSEAHWRPAPCSAHCAEPVPQMPSVFFASASSFIDSSCLPALCAASPSARSFSTLALTASDSLGLARQDLLATRPGPAALGSLTERRGPAPEAEQLAPEWSAGSAPVVGLHGPGRSDQAR